MRKGIYTVLTRFDHASCLIILNHHLSNSIDADYAIDNIINKGGIIIVEYINDGERVITRYYQTTAYDMPKTIDRYVSIYSDYVSNDDCIKALYEVYMVNKGDK